MGVLLLLTFVNLFNYIDRYILAALAPSIQADLGLSDTETGFLGTAFMFAYFLVAPLFGWLGDRFHRFRLCALGVGLWSLATMTTGWARSFWGVVASRAAVGVGEASYGSISPPLLGDYFPPDRRGRVFALFFMAIPVGSALGYLLGGLLGARFGWRNAFLLAGFPGILLALALLFLRDPPRGRFETEEEREGKLEPFGRVLAGLWKNRGYVWTVAGYTAYTFVSGGVGFWIPAYLVRALGVELEHGNFVFGAITVAGGFAGTFAGGFWADRWARRSADAYIKLSALSMFAATPVFILLLGIRDFFAFGMALFVFEFLFFLSTSPVNAQLVSSVPVAWRAMAQAVAIFAIHLFGDAISPTLVGWVSDRSSLSAAMLIFPFFLLLAGAAWLHKVVRVFGVMPWPEGGMRLPRWQAHRGYCPDGVRENTLEAFRRARAAGAEMAELDVQLSRDGVPVVVHDKDILRVSGHAGRVEELTAGELERLARVPTLESVLSDRDVPPLFNVELKSGSGSDRGLESAVASVVKRVGAERRVLFSSFNPLALRRISRALPHCPRALLVTEEDDPSNRFYLRRMLLAFLARPHLLHLDRNMVTAELAGALASRRVPWAAWTVNDPGEARKLLALGAESVISDRPGVAG
ncbi:MAG: MFS transporter [Bdellovibrionales bacterium]|nr:MFS transporter [Bdellovibrionales bacterium]